MKQLYLLIIFLLALVRCSNNLDSINNGLKIQLKSLNQNERKILNRYSILVRNKLKLLEDINGVKYSRIIISEKLIHKAYDRYCISHYLRNNYFKGFKELNLTTGKWEEVKLYYFNNYTNYIK